MAPLLTLRVALAAATLTLALVAVPPAHAAYPDLGASYAVHDHETKGKNWHVEVEISKKTRLKARSLVVYVQECAATPFANRVKIDLKGRINFDDRPFDAGKGVQGTWSMHAQFTTPHELTGFFRVVTPTCDTGEFKFEAHAGGHSHGSSHHAGTRPGEFPALASASSPARSQVRRLWRGTLRAAEQLFPFYESALELRFRRYAVKWRRPLLFHLRHDGYKADKRILDPRRPESLVYWWPKAGSPILVGFMYRAPLGRPPKFGGGLLAWHSHIEDGRQGDNQMTHVWLTGDLRSALANCLPVKQLEQRIPAFRYSRPGNGSGHESRRCRNG